MNEIAERIVEYIRTRPPGSIISQSDISRNTKISKPTVGKYLPLLLMDGKLDEYLIKSKYGRFVLLVRI
jgi:DNA-binding Lrp family transcriptional regulator